MIPDSLRSIVRRLRHGTAFVLVVVTTLAVALGAVATMYGVVHAFLLSSLPYEAPDELVMVWSRQQATVAREESGRLPLSPGAYHDVATSVGSFSRTAAFFPEALTVNRAGEASRAQSLFVTGDFFPLLGRQAALGRTLGPADARPDAPPVVAISHDYWQRHFDGDPEVLGRTIDFGGRSRDVVGVLPADFRFSERLAAAEPTLAEPVDVWVPFDPAPSADQRGFRFLTTVARLRPGVGPEAAGQELAAYSARAARQFPETDGDDRLEAVVLREQVVGHLRPVLLTLLVATGVVLLIACVNLAALLLARLQKARHEIAIRLALGASRGRVFGETLAETVALALAGGVLALAVASSATGLVVRFAPVELFRGQGLGLDLPIVLFTLGLSLVAGLLLGLLPALRASRTDTAAWLGSGSPRITGRSRLAFSTLVAAQIALTTVLLIGMGLSVESFRGLLVADLGFDQERVLTFDLFLASREYRDPVAKTAFYRELLAELEALPGVVAAATNYALPLNGINPSNGLEIVGRAAAPGESLSADLALVDPAYFSTLGIPLLAGRAFRPSDTADSSAVAIVDQRLAERYFPDRSPLGRTIRIAGDEDLTIVGVVGPVRRSAFEDAGLPAVYLPYAQRSYLFTSFALRTTLDDPLELAPAVRRAVAELDPGVPISRPATLRGTYLEALAPQRLSLLLMSAFAGISLLLTLVGIYGIMTFLVGQRTREAGIRIALGARPRQVSRLVVRQGLAVSVVGTAVGLALAAAAGPVLATLAHGVDTYDPAVFGLAAAVLLIAAFVAYAPAARALGRVDPGDHLKVV